MVNFNQNLEKLLLLWNGVPSLMFLQRESCVNSIHSIELFFFYSNGGSWSISLVH